MNATNPTAPAAKPAQARKPSYPHFVAFAEKWLLPLISVRISGGQRENTYTWCEQWWAHRPVAVRIAFLHTAFEASRGPGASGFVTGHVDPHFRVILDAAKGPLHRCTPTDHVKTPSLPFEPIPAERISATNTRAEQAAPTEAGTGSAKDTDSEKKKPPPRFTNYGLWVQQWLLPVTSVRIAAQHREGTYTWCTRWWEHHSVAVRFALLHAAFEAAVVSTDKTAMSSLFTRQIDPTMRLVLDAANGPLHRCTPNDHVELPGLAASRVPRHWFGAPGARPAIERLGFGPDFRALAPGEGEGELS
ncbi:DUF4913 domain-containing protein [Nocardia farcinica]|uniref:DUF4913 domain-containing protein n=1 Tax=Nocardia farcinica TaxID=37329 RepID=UPI0024540D67|nr:DUF4913 domain-containing protein [Nocardia farcinica]